MALASLAWSGVHAAPGDWAQPAGDDANRRFPPLDQIIVDTVKNLRPAWSFSTGVLRGHEGAPLAVDNALYVVTPFPNLVDALELNHGGAILWKYAPRQDAATPAVMCCDTVNRGLAYAKGRIFLQQADNAVVALDAHTGQKLWAVKNGDVSRGESGTGAPFAVGGFSPMTPKPI